jgi:archaellum biogenesis protein FlaJ (TadC family)
VTDEAGKYLSIAALMSAGALGAWTARACHRARKHGLPGSDEIVWASLAMVYFLFAQTKLARVLGWLKDLGVWLRVMARQQHLYENRRWFQVAATVAVAVVVVILLLVGIVSMWDYLKRYRLAIGFTGLAVGLGFIRFISLHEVDAWNAALPWLRVVVDVTAAAGASTVAILRLRQLREAAAGRSSASPAT